MSRKRIAICSPAATVIAAIGPGVCVGIANGGLRIFGPPEPPGEWDWLLGPVVLGFSSLISFWWIALAHQLLLGLPPYLLVRRHWQLRWWSAMIAGALIGAVPVNLFFLLSSGHDRSFLVLVFWLASFFAGSGAVAGLAFWVAVRDTKGASG